MTKFEPRYVVLKLKDIYALPTEDVVKLQEIVDKIISIREARGADPDTTCIVVESDWPEFEPTAQAIIDRVNAESSAPGTYTAKQLELPLDHLSCGEQS